MAADIHVYVQDAYRESRRLAAVSQELRDYAARIQGQEEELDAIWRGVSARRVSAALLGRQDDASKLADNVELIARGLSETADVLMAAQSSGGTSRGTAAFGGGGGGGAW